ncbi:MAG: glycosyltransferase [Myxococcaceae bacterium]|nr:glycosyltransferase [Myxococcaceae bacterium]MCI0673237.1 glycosyltransferase [Myxococcaceae bacterium]
MRILHLLASPAFSGPAENVAQLALAQRALGHDVSVAVDVKRARVSSEELAVPRLRALGLLDGGGLELSVKSAPWRVLADAWRLRARDVDVVHAHFTHDHFVARLGRPRGAVLVRSLHAPRSLRRSMPAADAFTVTSEGELARLGAGRALVLPPLVGPEYSPAGDRAALRKALGVDGAPLVGMVSTFQPSRRHDVGVEAFARVRAVREGARLVLVGDGEEEPRIRARVSGLGLADAVRFTGYQQGADFVRWLQALDEVWVLGLGNDWTGRVAAQARACGVRIVAVDEGALARTADVVLSEPTPASVSTACLEGRRREVQVPGASDVALQVLALYARARGAS